MFLNKPPHQSPTVNTFNNPDFFSELYIRRGTKRSIALTAMLPIYINKV